MEHRATLDYREIRVIEVSKERGGILVFRDRKVKRERRVNKEKEVLREKEEILEYKEKMV